MKKFILCSMAGLLVAGNVGAVSYETCEYNNYLSHCCSGSDLLYFADGSKSQCFTEYKKTSDCDNQTVYFDVKDPLPYELYSEGKIASCPTRIIFRYTGKIPFTSFGHYGNGIPYENTANNTPDKINLDDNYRATESAKYGFATNIQINIPQSFQDGAVKYPDPVAPKTVTTATSTTNQIAAPMTHAQIIAKVQEIMALIAELQKQLAAMK